MLCEVEAPGLVEILMLMTGMLMVKVNAAFADSEVDADSLSALAPFQLIGSSKPLPVLRATVIPSPFFQTLSGRPSELMSIRLYSSSLSEVTRPKPAEKLPEALFISLYFLSLNSPQPASGLLPPAPKLKARDLPPWIWSSPQSTGSVKA